MRTTTLFVLCLTFVILPLARCKSSETAKPECRVVTKDESLRTLLPPCWYQKVAGWEIVTFKKHMHYGHELSLEPMSFRSNSTRSKLKEFKPSKSSPPRRGALPTTD